MDYEDLVSTRKACRLCHDLINPADPTLVQYDGPEIGPWSRWLASRPAKIIVVGQDWGTERFFRETRGLGDPNNPTRQKLTEFLSLLGFKVDPANKTDETSGIFATNAILCLKRSESLSASVKQVWFSNCGRFLKSTIEASSAPSIIALGRPAYESVMHAYGKHPQRDGGFRAVVDSMPIDLDPTRRLFAVYHPAARPHSCSIRQMREDWMRITTHLRDGRMSLHNPSTVPASEVNR
jgi:Uracil DNA glycosylase superfamily